MTKMPTMRTKPISEMLMVLVYPLGRAVERSAVEPGRPGAGLVGAAPGVVESAAAAELPAFASAARADDGDAAAVGLTRSSAAAAAPERLDET